MIFHRDKRLKVCGFNKIKLLAKGKYAMDDNIEAHALDISDRHNPRGLLCDKKGHLWNVACFHWQPWQNPLRFAMDDNIEAHALDISDRHNPRGLLCDKKGHLWNVACFHWQPWQNPLRFLQTRR